MSSSKPVRNKDFVRSLLIFGYIAAVLLFSGLARADVGTTRTANVLLDEVGLISNSNPVLAER